MAGVHKGLKRYSQEALKAAFKNGELEAVSDLTRHGTQEVRHPKTGKQFTISVDSPNRTVVTSDNRDEFMAKKLGLKKKQEAVYDEEHEDEPKFGVKYHNSKGEEEAIKHFDDELKAKEYMERGNKLDKVGGKYSFHKRMGK
ncbi:hypothetical protein UFOVP42_50 [uncultured Caudovirales phage]|uniref:Uncharacterized protein n=1 Tax=uncultured Caudovirales phage TaxID=2100421 RepID=A0A6J5KT64_9CAUD|nr:hypothetical protein UFOVP42_50 [uncultured Caudovirales phage]